jgi:hypothetical protein
MTRPLRIKTNLPVIKIAKYYLIDTRNPIGNCALFWRPNGAGYTTDLKDAGLFEKGYSSRETDIEIPEYIVQQCTVTHVELGKLRDVMNKAGIKWGKGK